MTTNQYISLAGVGVEPNDLRIPRAREFAKALTSRSSDWVRLVDCQRLEASGLIPYLQGSEAVVFDVEIEVPQKKRHQIHRLERIAAVFWPGDKSFPEVLALRSDFPIVPHRNLRPFEIPRSLCLSEIPYSEMKLRWTAPAFIEDIRTWLAKTAEGTLHAPDQQLEPLFLPTASRIILPSNFLSFDCGSEHLSISRIDSGNNQFCLLAERSTKLEQAPDGKNGPDFVAATIVGSPQTHGIVHRQPTTLYELHEFMKGAGIDLCAALRERLRQWHDDNAVLNASLVIILVLPKRRKDGGPTENSDVWVFICLGTEAIREQSRRTEPTIKGPRLLSISELGEQLDVWQNTGGKLGIVLRPDLSKQGESVQIDLLNPSFALSRESAAQFNDRAERYGRNIVAVGLGAVGSQVFLNLIRSGHGEWTLVDKDLMLPHNLARHALYGAVTGHSKAEPLAIFANNTIDGPPIAKSIVSDVLEPGDVANTLEQSCAEASEILDFSASVAVARHLSYTVSSSARRASFFLNPQGTDSVMLVEDIARQTPLSALEMQYYRLLIHEPELHSHLSQPAEPVRYAKSCRDISSTISQDQVALHAAIGSRALRQAFESDGSLISIWRSADDGGVYPISFAPAPLLIVKKGGWNICADQILLERVRALRSEKLPNETGGILIGAIDLQYRTVHVVDALSAPSDSTEEPTGFVRGLHRLTEAVEGIERITAGQLTYVGEWHSHPTGASVRPSKDDRKLLKWLSERMAQAALPAIMLIVGGRKQYAWYFGKTS